MCNRTVSGYKVWRHCLSSFEFCSMRCWARCRPLVISGIAFMVLCALRVWHPTVVFCTLLSPHVIALRECEWRHANRDVWAMFFSNELVFCDAEICNQSCLSKSMAEIQPVLTLAAEEKAVSVMCLRWVLLFIEEVMHHEQQNASWTTCPRMLLLEAIPCYKNVTTIFNLMQGMQSAQ